MARARNTYAEPATRLLTWNEVVVEAVAVGVVHAVPPSVLQLTS